MGLKYKKAKTSFSHNSQNCSINIHMMKKSQNYDLKKSQIIFFGNVYCLIKYQHDV